MVCNDFEVAEIERPPGCDPAAYLMKRFTRFGGRDGGTQKAVQDFALIWFGFESCLLSSMGSPNRLEELAATLQERCAIDAATCRAPLRYWQQRFFRDGQPTQDFLRLRVERFKQAEHRRLVWQVLSARQPVAPAEAVKALLFIVYRLRNNLFQSDPANVPWRHEDYVQACAVMMSVWDASDRLGRPDRP